MSTSFTYDESTAVMQVLAEVTIVTGLGAFVPQLVSRASALVRVLHAETELCVFLERSSCESPLGAPLQRVRELGTAPAEQAAQVSWGWCWLGAGRCGSRKAELGRSCQLQQCPSAWLFPGEMGFC